MTDVIGFCPLLTGLHRYDKSLSVRGHAPGTIIEAPILAYLIETRNGRMLYDVGCDYRKVNESSLRERYYNSAEFAFGPPVMREEDQLSHRLARLGLRPLDIDLVFIGHLHFDHAGGLCDMAHAQVHVHARELEAARLQADTAYFPDDFSGDYRWVIQRDEYALCDGVTALESPGHTAGHMSLLLELPRGKPILLTGDAADLEENLVEERAPGLCWCEREDLALNSIRKLKRVAQDTDALLWPNHDLAFYRRHDCYPDWMR